MTHHNATFVAIATDGESAFFGLSENGETAVGNYDIRLFANLIRHEVLACIDADRPLVVVIGKNRPRATAGELFLYNFALAIVREALTPIPETLVADFAGEVEHIRVEYYSPRVSTSPLPWATRLTPMRDRVRSLLVELAFTDAGLELIPKGHTYAAG